MCLSALSMLIKAHGPVLQSTASLTVDMLSSMIDEVGMVSSNHESRPITDSVGCVRFKMILCDVDALFRYFRFDITWNQSKLIAIHWYLRLFLCLFVFFIFL